MNRNLDAISAALGSLDAMLRLARALSPGHVLAMVAKVSVRVAQECLDKAEANVFAGEVREYLRRLETNQPIDQEEEPGTIN